MVCCVYPPLSSLHPNKYQKCLQIWWRRWLVKHNSIFSVTSSLMCPWLSANRLQVSSDSFFSFCVALVNILCCSDYLHPWPIFEYINGSVLFPKLFVVVKLQGCEGGGGGALYALPPNTVYICKRVSRALSPLLLTAFHTNVVNKLRPWGIEGSKQTNWLTCHLALALAVFTAGFKAEAAGF